MATAYSPRYVSEPSQRYARQCEHPGCVENGQFPAPKSRQAVEENARDRYFYFCKDHVREYNKKWDYFNGMSNAEIEQFQRDAALGHRPTQRISQHRVAGERAHYDLHDMEDALHRFFHFNGSAKAANSPRLPQKERWALGIFDMIFPVSRMDVKKRYKELVKRHHPDRHLGDKKAEEQFKQIREAYDTLQKSEFIL